MIKYPQLSEETDLPEADYLLRKKLQTVEIRKNNREVIFSKRRFQEQYDSHGPDKKIKINHVDLRITEIEGYLKMEPDLARLEECFEAIRDDDIFSKHWGVIMLRKLLALEDDPPTKEVIDNGFVTVLLKMMKDTEWPQLQLEAAWAITNIAAGESSETASIVEKGAIEVFLETLSHPLPGVREQVIWGLGNLAVDNTIHRDIILQQGGMEKLLSAYAITTDVVYRNEICCTISNLCRGSPTPEYDKVKNGVALLCQEIATRPDTFKPDNISDCLWAISYHCDAIRNQHRPVIDSGLHRTIIHLMSTSHAKEICCIRILGNLSTGNWECTEALLDADILQALARNLKRDVKKSIRRETCWTLSNIAAGKRHQSLQILKDGQLIKDLYDLFQNDCEEVRKQICYIFSNIVFTQSDKDLDDLYIQIGVIDCFLALLDSEEDNILAPVLETISTLLYHSEKLREDNSPNKIAHYIQSRGFDKVLEELQYSLSEDVYYQASKAISYFETEDPLTKPE